MAATAEFLAAFKAAWVAQATLTPYGVPRRRITDTPTMPYVRFSSVSNLRIGGTNKSEIWEHTFRLEVRDKTEELVDAHVQVIGRAVDTMALTFASGSHVQTKRISEEPTEAEADYVCVGILTYEVTRQKARETAPS